MRIRHLTLLDALALLPYTTCAAACASVALVAVKAWRQPGFAFAPAVIGIAACSAAVASAFGLWLRRRRIATPTWMDARGAASWVLGLQLGVLLLPIVVFALVKGVPADDLHWTWPFLNKRWLMALYALAVSTVVVFPVACEWWRSAGGARMPASGVPARPQRPSWGSTAGGLVAVIALAWYFGGPPWHLDRHHREVEMHEQAHLGALQAISKGALPYIGSASTQYGPGSQVLLFAAMRQTGRFDIVSFRTAWATLNFLALLIVASAAFFWLELWSAVAVLVIAVVYSPLAFFGTASDGTLRGFFGWANALRYIAPLVIVPALVRASGVDRKNPPLGSPWVIVLGLFWGVASWVSQENLSSTALAAGLLLLLFCLTRTVSVSCALRVARDLLAGFAIAWTPVVVFYATHGALGAFVENYLAVPSAVAAGFSNTWWPAGASGSRTFYALPFVVVALTVATLWRIPSLTLCAPLGVERARLLAFLAVQCVCGQVALLRSDPGHLQNATMALPFILVLGFSALPRWLATPSLSRSTIRCGFVVAALAILPSGKLLQLREIVLAPATRFLPRESSRPQPVPDARIAYARATPLLTDETLAIGRGTLTMREWLDFATRVHQVVGSRPTFVADFGEILAGALYFFADLMPAPYPLDRDTMTINDAMQARVVEHIRSHPADYECFVGATLDAPEALAFLEVHPGAEHVERVLGPTRVHILLARPGP